MITTKLVEFFEIANSEQKQDPLLVIVADLRKEENTLRTLKSKTFEYLIPLPGPGKDKSLLLPGFDPDRMPEVQALRNEIENSKTKIGKAQDLITEIDRILAAHPKILTPVLYEIIDSKASKERQLQHLENKIGITLGFVLERKIHNILEAEKHPDVIACREAFREQQALLSPIIQELSSVIDELKGVIS